MIDTVPVPLPGREYDVRIGPGLIALRAGIGWWLAESAIQLDMPVLMCVGLFMGLVFVVTNLTLDILYAYIDPRIRLN